MSRPRIRIRKTVPLRVPAVVSLAEYLSVEYNYALKLYNCHLEVKHLDDYKHKSTLEIVEMMRNRQMFVSKTNISKIN